jgi:hypothetical protein
MKGLALLAILVGSLLLFGVLYRNVEPFVPEFLEQSNVKRTFDTSHSSYEQRTNHAIPLAGPDVPLEGVPSAYRVNSYNAFIV